MKEFDLNSAPLEGTNLIEAGAGTGKTYNIAGLYVRLILEKKLIVNEILVVTFTRAATEELKDRIRCKLRETIAAFKAGRSRDTTLDELIRNYPDRADAERRLQSALRGFDEAAIFTIHGFCQRVLHDNAFESGSPFDTELVADQWDLLKEIVEDFWRKYFHNASPGLINYLGEKNGLKIDSPDKLLKVIGGYHARLFLKVIPRTGIGEHSRHEDDFRTILKNVKLEWQKSRREIERILMTTDGLNRNMYRKSSIPVWISAMDALLTGQNMNPNLFDRFDKFTSASIQRATKNGFEPPVSEFFRLCDNLYQTAVALREAYDRYFLGLKIKLFDYLGDELTERKRNQNINFYDDLLNKVYKTIHGPNGDTLAGAIRKRYKAALIDEFQDTDPVQYDIFKTIYANRGGILFLIGDPKQAIYGFRGADIFAYMEAVGEVDNGYTLSRNWRSERGLIEAVNEIFAGASKPFVFGKIPFLKATPAGRENEPLLRVDGKSEPPFQIWFIDTDSLSSDTLRNGFITKATANDLLSQAMAAEISRLLRLGDKNKITIGERSLQAGDIAILVRTNKEALIVQQSLRALDIPCVLYSTENIFDSREALEMSRVLAAIAEPGNEVQIKAALTTDMIGIGGEKLLELINDDARWESWLNKFRDYLEMWSKESFIGMFRNLLTDSKVRSRLLAFPDGERRMTNLLHLSEILHQQDAENSPGITGLLKWLSLMRNPDSQRIEQHQLRLESDENAVKIVTIHKSKGLEYRVVFCPFVWGDSRLSGNRENIFHNDKKGNELTLDLGSDEYDPNRKQAEKELLAENLRLLYVALTRARHRCYLPWGRLNKAGTSAPAYLLHQPNIMESAHPVDEIESRFSDLDNADIHSRLEHLRDNSEGAIQLSSLPLGKGSIYSPVKEDPLKLKLRRFSGSIDRKWRISSFSHLVSGKTLAVDLPDHDSLEIDSELIETDITPGIEKQPDIFDFPRGARPGTFCHELFEYLDFANYDDRSLMKLVNDKLKAYGFKESWSAIIVDMVKKVIGAPLQSERVNFTLSQITNENRLTELEFYFPLKVITPGRLKAVFDKFGCSGVLKDFPETIDRLRFSPVQGFMKGYIDLVFRYRDKYYILDWKSNYLGARPENYCQGSLVSAMVGNFYILQYHIYTLAMHKYLSARISDYSYDKHFGGVIYIFLRGVDPRFGDQSGIFMDKPSAELINELSELLIAESRK